jgi:V8-like Glu-specific endopeptidase
MKSTDFDQIAKSWAARTSRRQMLSLLGGGAAAAFSASRLSNNRVLSQNEATPAATPEVIPELDPLLPTLDPIPVGNDNYLVNGETVFIDPAVAESLVETPTVPITIQGETTLVNLETVVFPEGSPVAEGATPSAGGLPEAPCGLDNSEDVELYLGDLGVPIEFVAANQKPVGNLRWNSDPQLRTRYDDPGTVGSWRWCSGTLIAANLFLTAGHCFEQNPRSGHRVPRIKGTNDPIPRAEIATNMHVNFGFQLSSVGADQLGETFPVVELVEDQLGGLDYAIVRLEGTPGLSPYGAARIAQADPTRGSTICIIGHPLGTPKKIEAGPATDLVSDRILYNDIDTDFGSSGSGILQIPDGPIVGVHTTGGCTAARTGHNSGVAISALLRESALLRDLASGGPQTAA